MNNNQVKTIEWILRIGVFMTFFGHAIIAIQGNPNWFKYLMVVGIDMIYAQKVLVFIGCFRCFSSFNHII